MWVDSHCHIQLADESPLALLERAPEVDWLVAPGIDAASSQAALDLADQEPDRIVAAVGLHPHEADRWTTERAAISELAPRGVAIGEIGLDFYRDLSPRDQQEQAFVDQLNLATELDLPAVVHCRDAFSRIHDLVESTGTGERVVMHCWTGGPRWTQRFDDLGVTFSFAGPVAFETGETVRLGAERVPPDRAMVETDTPYLAPPPHRSEPNEPEWVSLVGEALAEVWGVSSTEAAAVTSATASRVFG